MAVLVHCPFCFWQRMKDSSKGAPPFDLERALHELNRHMPAAHPDEMKTWAKIIRQEDAAEHRS